MLTNQDLQFKKRPRWAAFPQLAWLRLGFFIRSLIIPKNYLLIATDPRLNPEKIRELVKSNSLANRTAPMLIFIFIFDKCTMDRQDVNIRGNWMKLYMGLCSILQFPYESKMISKIHNIGKKHTSLLNWYPILKHPTLLLGNLICDSICKVQPRPLRQLQFIIASLEWHTKDTSRRNRNVILIILLSDSTLLRK